MSNRHLALSNHHPTKHSWGPNNLVAVTSECDITIYDMSSKVPKQKYVLKEHKHRVTDVDWHIKTNKILSCGEDRNAYVWNLDGDEWKPTLVVLRVNRAANCARWTTVGNKFAVGTTAKNVMICNYDESHDFWVSKSIRKFKSAVTCVAWDPKGRIIAAGGTDMRVRICNACVPDIGDNVADVTQFANKQAFGGQYMEIPSMGPVNAVAFNEDGTKLAFCSQSSQVTLCSFNGADVATTTKQCALLPFTTCLFVGDTIYFGGHNKQVYSSKVAGDDFSEPELVVAAKKAAKKSKNEAFNMFQKMANTGGKGAGAKKKKAETAHTFAITSLARNDKGFSSVANGDRDLVDWTI